MYNINNRVQYYLSGLAEAGIAFLFSQREKDEHLMSNILNRLYRHVLP